MGESLCWCTAKWSMFDTIAEAVRRWSAEVRGGVGVCILWCIPRFKGLPIGELWLLFGEMQVWGDGMVAVAMDRTSVLWEIWSLKLLTIRDGCSVVGVVDPVLLFSGAAPIKQNQIWIPHHINYLAFLLM